jgi:threonine dehydratase
MVQEYVDDVILLSEEEIAEGMAFALNKDHLIVEGAGAAGIAALLARKVRDIRGKVVVHISGGNVDIPLLLKIAQDAKLR